LVLDFQFLDDNMDVGHALTLQCAFIGGVKLIEVRCVKCLETLFLEATNPSPTPPPFLLCGIKSWASLNQIEGLKAQHKHPKEALQSRFRPQSQTTPIEIGNFTLVLKYTKTSLLTLIRFGDSHTTFLCPFSFYFVVFTLSCNKVWQINKKNIALHFVHFLLPCYFLFQV
jgi:hypothetical protein